MFAVQVQRRFCLGGGGGGGGGRVVCSEGMELGVVSLGLFHVLSEDLVDFSADP